LNVRAGRSTAFEQAFAEAQDIICGMLGYVSHQLRRCIEAPDRYLLLVNWRRLEDFANLTRTKSGGGCYTTSTNPFPVVKHLEAVFERTAREDAPAYCLGGAGGGG
jgi:hypothetical protein